MSFIGVFATELIILMKFPSANELLSFYPEPENRICPTEGLFSQQKH